MLSFATNLTNELRDRHASAYWYIRLYYGDETAYTGLSDSDRLLNAVKYRGLVLDWGGLNQTVSLADFKPGAMNLNNLTISNKDDAISGGRFSDLFVSKNYVNRKFTLHMGAVGVAYAGHEQIAQGIITDQVKQTTNNLTLRLVEDTSSVQKEVPVSRVNTTDHPNAPTTNIGKPIPMAYGDFGLKTDIGGIPTIGAEFDKHLVKGHFPAIITDQWNATDANVIATPDSETMNALDLENIFYEGDGQYSACNDSNADFSTETPYIKFKGSSWFAYFPMQTFDTYSDLWADYANSIDGDFDTYQTYITSDVTHQMTTGYRIPQIPKLGEFTAINIFLSASSYGGVAPSGGAPTMTYAYQLSLTNDYELTWTTTNQTIDITAEFTTENKAAWDLSRNFLVEIDDTTSQEDDQTVRFRNLGVEIEFSPSQTFLKKYITAQITNGTTRRRTFTSEVATPVVSEYIYYSGKGREYGAWVDADSRNNGYDSGALIENPVYMIEDILRTELSLTSSDINYASFDTAGNTTNGTIGNTFNLAVASIEYAFCQYQFQDAWALCQELASACGCLLFFSGDGTIKIIARQRDEDYTSSDRTIKFEELSNINPDITPLAQVRNKVSVGYGMDYAQDTLQDTTADVEDATSQGSGANGIGGASDKVQELISDNRFTLDSGTAVGYSTALLDWLAYRKKTLTFDVLTPRHNDLEIADTLAFSDWPSTFKIYGNTITSTDIYMITKITKKPNGCSISCQEVSEVTD